MKIDLIIEAFGGLKDRYNKLMADCGHYFSDKTIWSLIRNEYVILSAILALAYVLRILPYLLGYPVPFTEDGIRDFQQVKYLIDNSRINLVGSYGNYGAFPVLHLFVYGISRLGVDALKAFLFIPQLLPVIGLLFFYLFVKRHFSKTESLAVIFCIAVFGPHILWSSQPVRETIGLCLFPIMVWLFSLAFDSAGKKRAYALCGLIFSALLMIPAHHWSSLMILVWMISYCFIFIDKKENRVRGLAFAGIFFSLMIAYWSAYFPDAFNLLISPIKKFKFWLAILAALLLAFVWLINKLRSTPMEVRGVRMPPALAACVAMIMVACIGFAKMPILYPLQIWSEFLIYALIIFVGWRSSMEQSGKPFIYVAGAYLIFWIIALPYVFAGLDLYSIPLDPFRTIEFVIFPLSIIAAQGFLSIWKQSQISCYILVAIMLLLATLIYPPIFIYKSRFLNTPFYDIRSDIRYISPGEMELIKWANDHGYNVDSIVPEIRSYQEAFFPPTQEKLALVAYSDRNLSANYGLIKEHIMRVHDPEIRNGNLSEDPPLFSNSAGQLRKLLTNDADFELAHLPAQLSAGETAEAIFRVRNSGTKKWPAGKYKLAVKSGDKLRLWGVSGADLTIDSDVEPNESEEIRVKIIAPRSGGKYSFKVQMTEINVESFGEMSQTSTIIVTQ